MKKLLVFILLAVFTLTVVSHAANTNKTLSRSGKIFTMVQTDTLGRTTGNSFTVYASSTTGWDYGYLEGPESLAVFIVAYGDADSSNLEVKIDEMLDGVTWCTVVTDTMKNLVETPSVHVTRCRGIRNGQYRAVLSSYGTTDSVNILKLKVK